MRKTVICPAVYGAALVLARLCSRSGSQRSRFHILPQGLFEDFVQQIRQTITRRRDALFGTIELIDSGHER
ncbi:MAG: hypothetical protein HZA88_16450 [Verrucomicrobia bacterium]|nr:hypothetical protein [Verrucomicrobiota bacterium]